ncbi:MAG: LysR family transcriptional regulator [Persicimonas sp.]
MSERFQQIHDIWNWLPAFRAVAETEHLPSASSMIHVSASALSRAVGRLEDYLGHELFDRSGQGMKLNARGERLLAAVRLGMRAVDDAVQANLDEEFRGKLEWSSSWSLSSLTLEALDDFTDDYPGVVPRMHTLQTDRLIELLTKGALDVAVITSKIEHEALKAVHLGDIPHSVYCGSTHPFFERDEIGWEDIEGGRFAAPLKTPEGLYFDGWPEECEREVVMEFDRMAVGYRACRDRGLLAVLPDIVAHEEPGLRQLVRIDAIPHRAFALIREPIGEPSPEKVLTDYLADVFDRRALSYEEENGGSD